MRIDTKNHKKRDECQYTCKITKSKSFEMQTKTEKLRLEFRGKNNLGQRFLMTNK